MTEIWLELQAVAVYVFFWPLTILVAFASGAAVLLALMELLMYVVYRALLRLGYIG